MAYKAFNNVVTDSIRPNYLATEARRYGKYGVNGKNRIEFTVTGPLFTNPTEATKRAVENAIERTANIGKNLVRPDTPVDTGLLKSRWYVKKVRWDEFRLSNDIFYAPFNEKRVQMLGRNIGKIESELSRQLEAELPRRLG